MKFVDNISKERYIKFFNSNKNAHFLQSYEWGMSSELSRNKKACFVGLEDDNGNIVAETLLLKKNTPLGMCYYYSPRGYVIDYENKELLNTFTEELKKFMNKEKAIYLRVNPGIKYQDIDENAIKMENGNNNYELFDQFINLGYKHQGFNKLYEGNEPRYTFRIDLNRPWEEINNSINKSFLKTIKRSSDYKLEVRESNDITTFHNLIVNNANKDNFNEYGEKYYQTFYDSFKEFNHVKIFEAIMYPDTIINDFRLRLAEMKKKISENNASETKIIDDINVHNRLEKELLLFEPLERKYPNGKVIGSLICVYTNYSAWTLYIGNDSFGTLTNAVNVLYYESIKDAKNNNYQFMDLFGTIGDSKTTYKNLAGIHEYKRKMGGEYIEFLGDFDLINKKTMYKLLPLLLKIYRTIKK